MFLQFQEHCENIQKYPTTSGEKTTTYEKTYKYSCCDITDAFLEDFLILLEQQKLPKLPRVAQVVFLKCFSAVLSLCKRVRG